MVSGLTVCIVSCQIKVWTANPQQFVEDEDDDTFSYSVRISAQDLLLVRHLESIGMSLCAIGLVNTVQCLSETLLTTSDFSVLCNSSVFCSVSHQRAQHSGVETHCQLAFWCCNC